MEQTGGSEADDESQADRHERAHQGCVPSILSERTLVYQRAALMAVKSFQLDCRSEGMFERGM